MALEPSLPESKSPQFGGRTPFLACSTPVIGNLLPKYFPTVIRPPPRQLRLLSRSLSFWTPRACQPTQSYDHSSLLQGMHSPGEAGGRKTLDRHREAQPQLVGKVKSMQLGLTQRT